MLLFGFCLTGIVFLLTSGWSADSQKKTFVYAALMPLVGGLQCAV